MPAKVSAMAYWEWKWMPDALRTKLPKALERVTGKINGCSASKKEDLRNDDSAYCFRAIATRKPMDHICSRTFQSSNLTNKGTLKLGHIVNWVPQFHLQSQFRP